MWGWSCLSADNQLKCQASRQAWTLDRTVTVKHERNRDYAQASLLTSLGTCVRLLEVPGPTVSGSLTREACGYSVELCVSSQKFWFYFYHFHFARLLTHSHLSRIVVFKKKTGKGVNYEREGWERLFESEGDTNWGDTGNRQEDDKRE